MGEPFYIAFLPSLPSNITPVRGETGSCWLYRLDLALDQVSGRVRAEAREVVGYVVEHVGELRETFMARPEVVSLFN